MFLAKSTGPVYMGVEYGLFGKFRFMTQAAYDALSSYDNDTIYFDFQRLMDKIVIGFGNFERFLVKIINVRNEHE